MRIKKRCEGGGAGERRTKKRRRREKEFLAEGRKLFNDFFLMPASYFQKIRTPCQRPVFKIDHSRQCLISRSPALLLPALSNP